MELSCLIKHNGRRVQFQPDKETAMVEKKVNPQNPGQAKDTKGANTSWMTKMRESMKSRKTGSHMVL
jgi:hypothetical protein